MHVVVNAFAKLRGSISHDVNSSLAPSPHSPSSLTIAAMTMINNAVGTKHNTKKCTKLARCTRSIFWVRKYDARPLILSGLMSDSPPKRKRNRFSPTLSYLAVNCFSSEGRLLFVRFPCHLRENKRRRNAAGRLLPAIGYLHHQLLLFILRFI